MAKVTNRSPKKAKTQAKASPADSELWSLSGVIVWLCRRSTQAVEQAHAGSYRYSDPLAIAVDGAYAHAEKGTRPSPTRRVYAAYHLCMDGQSDAAARFVGEVVGVGTDRYQIIGEIDASYGASEFSTLPSAMAAARKGFLAAAQGRSRGAQGIDRDLQIRVAETRYGRASVGVAVDSHLTPMDPVQAEEALRGAVVAGRIAAWGARRHFGEPEMVDRGHFLDLKFRIEPPAGAVRKSGHVGDPIWWDVKFRRDEVIKEWPKSTRAKSVTAAEAESWLTKTFVPSLSKADRNLPAKSGTGAVVSAAKEYFGGRPISAAARKRLRELGREKFKHSSGRLTNARLKQLA